MSVLPRLPLDATDGEVIDLWDIARAPIGCDPPTQRQVQPSWSDGSGLTWSRLQEVLIHLRDTGMPLTGIAEFTRLVQRDPEGVPERLALLRAHRATIAEQIARLGYSMRVIDGKIDDYTQRLDLAGGSALTEAAYHDEVPDDRIQPRISRLRRRPPHAARGNRRPGEAGDDD